MVLECELWFKRLPFDRRGNFNQAFNTVAQVSLLHPTCFQATLDSLPPDTRSVSASIPTTTEGLGRLFLAEVLNDKEPATYFYLPSRILDAQPSGQAGLDTPSRYQLWHRRGW